MPGLSRENVNCFRNFQDLCNNEAVTIGLERGEITSYWSEVRAKIHHLIGSFKQEQVR